MTKAEIGSEEERTTVGSTNEAEAVPTVAETELTAAETELTAAETRLTAAKESKRRWP